MNCSFWSPFHTEGVYSLRIDSFFIEPYKVNAWLHIKGEFPQSEQNTKKRIFFIRPWCWILRLVAKRLLHFWPIKNNAYCCHGDVGNQTLVADYCSGHDTGQVPLYRLCGILLIHPCLTASCRRKTIAYYLPAMSVCTLGRGDFPVGVMEAAPMLRGQAFF